MEKTFFMIDLDGTMYRGKDRIDGAKEWIEYLNKKGISFLFLTNNASRTQQQACDHMLKMGFTGIEPRHFYTSAMAAAQKIAHDFPNKKEAYYIGEDGLREALIEQNFAINSTKADFLFIGLDRHADYTEYSNALRCVTAETQLVATNDDRLLISEKGVNIGNGSVVAMFEYATARKSIKIGKPYAPIIDYALRYANVERSQVMLVGDNLETDILCGIQNNIETTLVTTGVHNMEGCRKLQITPTYIVADLFGLIKK